MAEIDFLLGAAFLNQTTLGTATTMPTIGAGSGTGSAIDNATDGAVLGQAGAGVGDSGIDLTLGKTTSEKAVVTGSFTKDFDNFVGRAIDSFQFTMPLKGNGETTTATPIAADFTPDIGIAALYRAAGLTGGADGATWRYIPASTDYITAAVYSGNEGNNGARYVLKDLTATGVTFDFSPGEVATATFALAGSFDSADETGSWTSTPFDYGNQSTLSAPAVVGVGFTWGPDTPASRSIGFSELSIAIDNGAEEIASSNAAAGSLTRQTSREIVITGTIDATDAEFLFEADQLAEDSIANAEALTFTVGTAATGSDTANAYTINIPTPELFGMTFEKLGNSGAYTIELKAKGASANSEFELIYL